MIETICREGQASVEGGGVGLEAFGVTTDPEKRDLLVDSLKAMLAMWRLAAQEKSPGTVSMLRRFKIESESEGVSISGTLPASFLRSLSSQRGENH